jgi:hypothetical protein
LLSRASFLVLIWAQIEDALRLHEAVGRQLMEAEGGSIVDVIDVCGAKVDVVGAIGSGRRDDKAAAAAPSPRPFLPQPEPQQAPSPDMPHLSVPRLIDAFLQPPSPKQQQHLQQLPRRLSSDEQQQNSPIRCNDPGSPTPLATRRPSADNCIPLMTQRAAGGAAAAPSSYQPANAPAIVTPGGPPQTASSWSLSIMRDAGDAGVDLVQVQLMIGDNLIGAPKGQQEEHGLVVRLRR